MDIVRDLPLLAPRAEHAPPRMFGALLRQALGEHAWRHLHADIRSRFGRANGQGEHRFEGTMHWVYCSPVGALIARVLQRASILPARCARGARFSFLILPRRNGFAKERAYHWRGGESFTFRSLFDDSPRLHEEFSHGLGMYLKLEVVDGALLFRDQGYFLRIGQLRIPLPPWATVGRFELRHRNIDARRFQIIIRLHHWLFGTLFYQRGEFQDAMQ